MSDKKDPDGASKDANQPEDAVEVDAVAAPSPEGVGAEPVESKSQSVADAETPAESAPVSLDKPRPAAEVAPEPEPEPDHHDHHDDYHEEAERTSLAARALQVVAILLVGGGLALWIAPKVAPHLPEGVARQLMPADTVMQADLDALRAEMQTALAAVPTPPEAEPVDLDAALAPLREDLAAVATRLDQAEPAAIDARLAQAETKLAGVVAQLEALSAGLSDLDASAGDISPAAAERLAAFAGMLEGVKAELDSVSSRTAGLAQRLDEAEAGFAREAEAAEARAAEAAAAAALAERTAELDHGFALLTEALDQGAPLTEGLAALTPYGDAPAALAAAEGGVATLAALRVSLTAAAHEALSAHRMAEAGDGAGNRLYAAIRSRIEGVPVVDTGGDGVDAALGRASERLADGDLDAALAALDGLPPAPAAEMADWIATATARRDAVAAAARWRMELSAQAS